MAKRVFSSGDQPGGSKCAFPERYGVTPREHREERKKKGSGKRKRKRGAADQ